MSKKVDYAFYFFHICSFIMSSKIVNPIITTETITDINFQVEGNKCTMITKFNNGEFDLNFYSSKDCIIMSEFYRLLKNTIKK